MTISCHSVLLCVVTKSILPSLNGPTPHCSRVCLQPFLTFLSSSFCVRFSAISRLGLPPGSMAPPLLSPCFPGLSPSLCLMNHQVPSPGCICSFALSSSMCCLCLGSEDPRPQTYPQEVGLAPIRGRLGWGWFLSSSEPSCMGLHWACHLPLQSGTGGEEPRSSMTGLFSHRPGRRPGVGGEGPTASLTPQADWGHPARAPVFSGVRTAAVCASS